ncbi:MAG TPA: hypothetical protein ENK09_06695 [Nitrospirae bacterium]|nr:hypothetical protein [Nitrospirota bacterium]
MKKTDYFVILSLVIFLFLFSIPYQDVSAETCCQRNVTVAIQGEGADARFAETAFDSVFTSSEHGGGPGLKCPVIDVLETGLVDKVPDHLTYHEYAFEGVLTKTTDIKENPPVYTYNLNVNLIDRLHGETLKSRAKSWYCIDREAGECLRLLEDNVKALAKSFHPLDKLIYDYEQIPEDVEIEPESEEVVAGEEIKIKVRVKDIKGRVPKKWQRILVKADKGRILNGTTHDGIHYEFEVGGGEVEVSYRAPEPCRNDTDKIEVYNSCTIDPTVKAFPEQKIGEKKLNIFCVEGTIIIKYRDEPMSSMIMNADPSCKYKKILRKKDGKITFRIKPTDDPCYYKVLQHKVIPLSYDLTYIPQNKEDCVVIKIKETMKWSLRNSSLGTFIDFKRNSSTPFYVDFRSQRNYLYKYGPLSDSNNYKHNEHNNMWPLKDGYSDDLNFNQLSLSIDQKAAEGLRKRCKNKK